MRLSALSQAKSESAWHVGLAVLVAIVLQLTLKDSLTFGPKYAIALLEAGLLVVLLIPDLSQSIKRLFAIMLVGLISLANIVSLTLVAQALFSSGPVNGRQLLFSSVAIYLTNIIVFGIWYWELDNTKQDTPDFSFPQQSGSNSTNWQPTFFDYLYVSITNATAFSPTDTMPLTHRIKLLMTLQSVVSLVTVVLVAARAVNILN